jgi:hypothetical protein
MINTNKPSISEFHDILQKEVIMYDWAIDNYPTSYTEKYISYRDDRIAKIIDISTRLNAVDILGSSAIYKMYYDKVFPNIGRPNFIYRNEDAKAKIDHHSIRYYYYPTRVMYLVETGEEVEVLGPFPEEGKVAVILQSSETEVLEYDKIKRNP